MTTTRTDALRKITALRDRALHASTPAPEAETALAMALKLCVKHDIDRTILDEPASTNARPAAAAPKPERRYTCRFGCSMWIQHTASEMSACADKARAASSTGNAYTAPKADPFADMFRDAAKPRTEGTAKPRANGSHATCSHEATKAGRAACRKARGF